jgi:hypothetical protein
MENLKQKTEGIINFINNEIDFELLTVMKEIILTPKPGTHPDWINSMTYEEWFFYFKVKSESLKLFRPRLKGTEISENQIILVLDYLKLNYDKFFIRVSGIERPNMAVVNKCKIKDFDPEFTKNIYDTIEIWENSKK